MIGKEYTCIIFKDQHDPSDGECVAMKITIDRDSCVSCGSCEEICPEVFKLDQENLSSIVPKHRKGGPGNGEIGDDLAECVESARDACPVTVIATE